MVSRFDKYIHELDELTTPDPNSYIVVSDSTESNPGLRTKKYRFSRLGAQNLTHAQIGDIAFSNPPTDLTDAERKRDRDAIGAGTSNQEYTDAQIGSIAFNHPPNDLSTSAKTEVRNASDSASQADLTTARRDINANASEIERLDRDKTSFGPKQRIALLRFRLDPPLLHLTAEHGEQIATFADTFSIHVDNPELLTGNFWYDIAIDDEALLNARIKWTTSTTEITFTPNEAQARKIVENLNVGDTRVVLTFYAFTSKPSDATEAANDVVEKVLLPLGIVDSLTDAEIGDKAFSSPPSDLTATELNTLYDALKLDANKWEQEYSRTTAVTNSDTGASFAATLLGNFTIGDSSSTTAQLYELTAYGEGRTGVDRSPLTISLLLSSSGTANEQNKTGDHTNLSIGKPALDIIKAVPLADYSKDTWLLGTADTPATITIKAGATATIYVWANMQGQGRVRNVRVYSRKLSLPL